MYVQVYLAGNQGEALESSRCAFLTEKECIEDAQKNGYSPPRGAE